jgi:hypothetical protein
MERRFGHDFGRVRVHTDGRAAESARAVGAVAYAVGSHVVFDQGQFDPSTPPGRHLLAHELAHVSRQPDAAPGDRLPVGPAFGPEEDAAEAAADGIAPPRGGPPAGGLEVQRFPWLAAGIVAGVAAGGIYAWWAYNCLKPVEIPMYVATFGSDWASGRSGGFRLWYYTQTGAPVPSNAWDAFGHCYVACAATKECGAFTTAIAGKSREFYREYLDSGPHDSYEQDTNNQTLGRGFGSAGKDCEVECRNAALPGGAMDLSAPTASTWVPGGPP